MLKTSEKIRILMKRKETNITEIAEATEQTRQNLNNKLSRDNFNESDLIKLANALGCDLEISFTDRETKEKL